MDSLDLQVLRQARDWLRAGRRTWLVTVAETWGSAPRPAGALLCLRDDGLVVGSVSGGCVEDDLIERVKAHQMKGGAPEVVTTVWRLARPLPERCAAKLPAPNYKRLIKEPALFEIAHKCRTGLVGVAALDRELRVQVPVLIPTRMHELHKAHTAL